MLWGIKIPVAKFLDQLQIETEFKNNRLGENTIADLAWVIILVKSIRNLTLYLTLGADPMGLGSKNTADIGAYMRLASSF